MTVLAAPTAYGALNAVRALVTYGSLAFAFAAFAWHTFVVRPHSGAGQ